MGQAEAGGGRDEQVHDGGQHQQQAAGAGTPARAAPARGRGDKDRKSGIKAAADKIDFLGIGLGKKVGKIKKFVHRVGDAIKDTFGTSSSSDGERRLDTIGI